MKQITIIPLLLIILVGCRDNPQHDKKIIKDANGNYYELEWRIGVCYALKPVDIKQLSKFNIKDSVICVSQEK